MTTVVERKPTRHFLRRSCLTLRRRKRQEFKEGKAKVMSMLESAEESIKTKEGEGSSTSQDGQEQGEGEGKGEGAQGLAEAKAAAAVTLREASDLVGTLQGLVARASLFLREKNDTPASRAPLDAPNSSAEGRATCWFAYSHPANIFAHRGKTQSLHEKPADLPSSQPVWQYLPFSVLAHDSAPGP